MIFRGSQSFVSADLSLPMNPAPYRYVYPVCSTRKPSIIPYPGCWVQREALDCPSRGPFQAPMSLNGISRRKANCFLRLLPIQIRRGKVLHFLHQSPGDNQHFGCHFYPHLCLNALLPFPAPEFFSEMHNKVLIPYGCNQRSLIVQHSYLLLMNISGAIRISMRILEVSQSKRSFNAWEIG